MSCSPSWSLKDRVQGGGRLLEAVCEWVRRSVPSKAGAFPLPHPPNVPGTGHHPPVPPAQMGLGLPGPPLQGSPSRDPW